MKSKRPRRSINAGTIIAALGILLWAGTLNLIAVASVASAPEARVMTLLFVHCLSRSRSGVGCPPVGCHAPPSL